MIYYIMKDNTSGEPIITTGHGQKTLSLESAAFVTLILSQNPMTPPTEAEGRDSACSKGYDLKLTYD